MGVNICLRDHTGRAAIHYACSRWQYDIVAWLLNHSENVIAISRASTNSEDDFLKEFSSQESLVAMKCSITGMTPLHFVMSGYPLPYSSGKRDKKLSESIITSPVASIAVGEQGILFNTTPDKEAQALSEMELMMKAGDCLRITRALLQAGAPPNVTDKYGRRPLQVLALSASRFGAALGPVVELMVSAGARIDDISSISISHVPQSININAYYTPSIISSTTDIHDPSASSSSSSITDGNGDNNTVISNQINNSKVNISSNSAIRSLLKAEIPEIDAIIMDATSMWISDQILDATLTKIDTHHEFHCIEPEINFQYAAINQSLNGNKYVQETLALHNDNVTNSNSDDSYNGDSSSTNSRHRSYRSASVDSTMTINTDSSTTPPPPSTNTLNVCLLCQVPFKMFRRKQ